MSIQRSILSIFYILKLSINPFINHGECLRISTHQFFCNYKFLLLVFILICGSSSTIHSQSLPPDYPLDDENHEQCPQIESGNRIRAVIVVDASSEIPDYSIRIAQSEIGKRILSIEYYHPMEVIITKLKNIEPLSTVVLEGPVFELDPDRRLQCDPESKCRREKCISGDEYRGAVDDYIRGQDTFTTAFEDHLSNLMKTQPSDDSPILQTLKSIDYIVDDEKIDQLYIVSDMLENSSLIDMYDSEIPDFEGAKDEIRRGYGFPEKTATTTVFLLNRCGDAGEIQQTGPFMSFWDDYFSYIMGDQPIWEHIPSGPCE